MPAEPFTDSNSATAVSVGSCRPIAPVQKSNSTLPATLTSPARLAEQQETVAAAATVAERARIAREVHDSVAHAVSVIVLQMGGLRRLLPDHPEAQEVLRGLERLGRDSVDEMRRDRKSVV